MSAYCVKKHGSREKLLTLNLFMENGGFRTFMLKFVWR